MATATGAFTKLAVKKESSWGVSPAGNYTLLPVKSFSLTPTQPFLVDRLLGQGREMRRPARDVKGTAGQIVIPMDLRAVGHWLEATFGNEVVTGAGPFTHKWRSNGATINSLSAEQQFTNIAIPVYSMAKGVQVNSWRFSAQASGFADATLSVLYKDAVDSTSSGAGTPTEIAVERFFQSQNVLEKDGVPLAKITGIDLNLDNGLEAQRYVGEGGAVGDIDIGGVNVSGTLTARFTDQALLNLAKNETLFDLRVGFERTGVQSLIWEIEQCELAPNGREVRGAGGIDLTFAWQGSKDTTEGQMLTVTLINDVASY